MREYFHRYMRAEDGASSTPSLRTLHADAEHRLATASNLVFSVENAAPTVQHLERVMSAVRDLARQQRGSVGLFIVIRPEARPPSDEVRARIVKLFSDIEGSLGALGYVMEGEGFIAAAKRSALTLMMATKRYQFPLKVFRTVADGVPWIAATVGADRSGPTSTARLVAEVQHLREEHYAG